MRILSFILFGLFTTSLYASWSLAGSTILQIRLFLFQIDVYQVSLFVSETQKGLLPNWENINELKLEFIYVRDVDKQHLETAWEQNLSETYPQEKSQIKQFTPDMKKNEKLIMIKKDDSFFLIKNEITLLEIKNKKFASEVMGIWLELKGKFPHVANILTQKQSGVSK